MTALVNQEKLTNWQIDRLEKDYRLGYFYGKYKILYMAGAGSFARVYRAANRENGRIYAVKVLRNRHVDDHDVAAQFIREGEVGKQLRHPNIVQVYDVDTARGVPYIAMEFVEGNTLKDFVRIRKKLDPVEATAMMIEIANGLRYAATQGYTHRDVKMTNVLVTSTGQPKWVDFGLAAKRGEEVPRTVDYAGLEKASGAPKDDPRSDLYFLGCIYYQMLSGQPALEETKNRVRRGAKSRFLDVAPLQHVASGLPRPVVAVVDRALQLDAGSRYQSPSEFLVELKRAAAKLAAGADDPASVQAKMPVDVSIQRPVMIVESNGDMQSALREGLKRTGYRVLLTGDPQRALARFDEEENIADCVIFSASEIGAGALEAFNQFGENERTKHIPAILLLGEDQRKWKKQAKTGPHRILLPMPLKLKLLRAALAKVLSKNKEEASS